MSYACICDKGEVEDTNDDGQNVVNDAIDKEKEEIAALEKMFANRFTDQDKSFVQVFCHPLSEWIYYYLDLTSDYHVL